MLARALNRIQEIPLDHWVTNAKVNAIRGEFMRQCDKLDGLADGIVNNYMACREIFDVKQGQPGRHPWAARRCPDNKDPNPADTSANACLTDGQIATLEWVYRPVLCVIARERKNDIRYVAPKHRRQRRQHHCQHAFSGTGRCGPRTPANIRGWGNLASQDFS
jgi:hypothetical protein